MSTPATQTLNIRHLWHITVPGDCHQTQANELRAPLVRSTSTSTQEHLPPQPTTQHHSIPTRGQQSTEEGPDFIWDLPRLQSVSDYRSAIYKIQLRKVQPKNRNLPQSEYFSHPHSAHIADIRSVLIVPKQRSPPQDERRLPEAVVIELKRRSILEDNVELDLERSIT